MTTTLYDWINTEKLYPFNKKTQWLCYFSDLDKEKCKAIGNLPDQKQLEEINLDVTSSNESPPLKTALAKKPKPIVGSPKSSCAELKTPSTKAQRKL